MMHIGNVTTKRGRAATTLPPGEVTDFLIAHDIRPLDADEVRTILRHLDDRGLIRYDQAKDAVQVTTPGEQRYLDLLLYQTSL